jgi:CheY-like chemotaxis protein
MVRTLLPPRRAPFDTLPRASPHTLLNKSLRAFARVSLGAHCLPKSRGLVLHGKRVLIVEDDYVTAQGLSDAIADNGFTVVGPVDTADRAVRLIDQEAPDGALLDVRLREGSSVEVARALQEHGVPFIVMSGYSRDTLPPELKKSPFVAKPMSESELIDTARSTFWQ